MLADPLHINPEELRVIYTMGGTYSVLQAMAIYVKNARRFTDTPILLVGENSHFAFDKAAELTGAQHILLPLDPKTTKVCLREL